MQEWKMTDKNYGVWKMQDWKMTDKLLANCEHNYRHEIGQRMAKIGLKDAYLHDESVTDVVRCLLNRRSLGPDRLYVFVTIGRGRTTYSRVTILACVG